MTPMQLALEWAERGMNQGEVPIGCVIADDRGQIIAASHNEVERSFDVSAHAEIVALRRAATQLRSRYLTGCDLYVTLEPCPMCAQAIAFARIRRVYYAASDPKGGGIEHGPRIFSQPTCHHRPDIYPGIGERPAAALLRAFFRARR